MPNREIPFPDATLEGLTTGGVKTYNRPLYGSLLAVLHHLIQDAA